MKKQQIVVLLQTDPHAGSPIAERQAEARELLDKAGVKFEEQHVTNDWGEGISTPMLQTATGLHTGIALIRLYAKSASAHQSKKRTSSI